MSARPNVSKDDRAGQQDVRAGDLAATAGAWPGRWAEPGRRRTPGTWLTVTGPSRGATARRRLDAHASGFVGGAGAQPFFSSPTTIAESLEFDTREKRSPTTIAESLEFDTREKRSPTTIAESLGFDTRNKRRRAPSAGARPLKTARNHPRGGRPKTCFRANGMAARRGPIDCIPRFVRDAGASDPRGERLRSRHRVIAMLPAHTRSGPCRGPARLS